MLTTETKELEAAWEMGKMIMEYICLHYNCHLFKRKQQHISGSHKKLTC